LTTETVVEPQDQLANLKKYDTKFLGHPAGVGWLSAAEFWERFSYYGMLLILVLYLQHYLLLPGHIEQVWGFEAFSNFIWSLPWTQFGPHNNTALASNTAQLYGGVVFVTPLIGGLLTDRFFRRTGAVATGAVLMVIGSFLVAMNQTFLIGLAFLLVGVGFFKSNIAAQVGDLYRIDDPRRATGFQIYFMGIQLAVIIAPVVTSTLSEKIEWHLGFVAAGVAMVLGLGIYMLGRKRYPPEPRREEKKQEARPPLTRRDWGTIALLVALLPILAFGIVGNQQIFNVYFLWAEKNYQLTINGWTMPAPFLGSLDAFVSAGTMIVVIAFWTWYGKKHREPDEITKIIIGIVISTFAPLVLALASARVAARTSGVAWLGRGVSPDQRHRVCQRSSDWLGIVLARCTEGPRLDDDRGLLRAPVLRQHGHHRTVGRFPGLNTQHHVLVHPRGDDGGFGRPTFPGQGIFRSHPGTQGGGLAACPEKQRARWRQRARFV